MLLVVSDEVITEWDIPQVGGGALSVSAVAGAITFIVGPNGSGKSSLGQWLETRLNPDQAHRVIAHRRLWMEGPGPAVTPAQRVSLRSNITQWDRMPDSRWLDHANHQRTDAVLFDLMSRENARNARAVRAYEAAAPGTPSEEIERSFLDRINTILSAAELPIEISLTDDGTFHAHSFSSGASYPVSELSDGEKSALLLAAEVLVTAAPIFIIDEPERHLHRSISAGLIAAVLAERTDCHFAVLTHDLDLASAVGGPRQLLLLTGCEWTGKSVAAWDIRAVSASEGIPDSVRRAVLGGTRQILFVEGEGSSLDAALYSILFPAWEIVPRGGCAQIQSAVSGLRSAADFHWVDASGIVDRDGRENDEITSLADQGVLVLGVHEIESVYYLPQVSAAGLQSCGRPSGREPRTEWRDTHCQSQRGRARGACRRRDSRAAGRQTRSANPGPSSSAGNAPGAGSHDGWGHNQPRVSLPLRRRAQCVQNCPGRWRPRSFGVTVPSSRDGSIPADLQRVALQVARGLPSRGPSTARRAARSRRAGPEAHRRLAKLAVTAPDCVPSLSAFGDVSPVGAVGLGAPRARLRAVSASAHSA
jgi:energy-coupling factor transporter ATP-binding protein EcfA2